MRSLRALKLGNLIGNMHLIGQGRVFSLPLPTPPSMRVRTRRFTREHTRGSGIAMGLHPHSADIDQPLALQPLIGHPGLCRRRLRQVPAALAAEWRQTRVASARS